MSSGHSTKLTGAAGEFLVAAELCRRGLLATPFAGNVPHYDIIASGQTGGHLLIQVKAINGLTWQFDLRRFVNVTLAGSRQRLGRVLPSPYPDLHIVLVALKGQVRVEDRFFILGWTALRDLLKRNYGRYLKKHRGVRPKNSHSFHVALTLTDTARFEGKWELLEQVIRRSR